MEYQVRRPDCIYVNLSRTPYLSDEGISQVPKWLDRPGVTVRMVENSGPYRKLIPTLVEAGENDLVVTADDDVLYGPNWLDGIVRVAERYPNHIVCAIARRIQRGFGHRYAAYYYWREVTEPASGVELLPIGAGGVAYRRRLMDMDMLTDRAALLLAPTTDDLWFRGSSLALVTPVHVDRSLEAGNSYIRHPFGLHRRNNAATSPRRTFVGQFKQKLTIRMRSVLGIPVGENDRAWKRVVNYLRDRQLRP